jgi:hypothetical protein
MTVTAPPQPPQPSPQELEALIQEARRRARRRRLVYAAFALALAIGAAVTIAVLLPGGGGQGTAVPPGYHLVQAKGPVAHARVEQRWRGEPRLVDLATGDTQRVGEVLEIWWDRKSGLDRVVGRIAGRVQYDTVGQTCDRAVGICFFPTPFDLARFGYRWPVPKNARVVERGTVRGRDVVWVEGLVVPGGNVPKTPSGDRVALDARTHQPVAKRSAHGGPLFSEFYTHLPDLPARSVSFTVPEGGAQRGFPPLLERQTTVVRKGLDTANDALGRTPLWLGRTYRGHRLRSVEVGTEGAQARSGATLSSVPFVRLDYGITELKEYGERPYWFQEGPPAGKLLVRGREISLSRDGLLVLLEVDDSAVAGNPERALAYAKALRPVEGG